MSSWSSDGVTVSNLTLSHTHTHTHTHSDVFHPDPDFLANEDKYKLIKEGIVPQPTKICSNLTKSLTIYTIFLISEILGEGSDSEEGSGSSGEDSSEEEDSEGTTL